MINQSNKEKNDVDFYNNFMNLSLKRASEQLKTIKFSLKKAIEATPINKEEVKNYCLSLLDCITEEVRKQDYSFVPFSYMVLRDLIEKASSVDFHDADRKTILDSIIDFEMTSEKLGKNEELDYAETEFRTVIPNSKDLISFFVNLRLLYEEVAKKHNMPILNHILIKKEDYIKTKKCFDYYERINLVEHSIQLIDVILGFDKQENNTELEGVKAFLKSSNDFFEKFPYKLNEYSFIFSSKIDKIGGINDPSLSNSTPISSITHKIDQTIQNDEVRLTVKSVLKEAAKQQNPKGIEEMFEIVQNKMNAQDTKIDNLIEENKDLRYTVISLKKDNKIQNKKIKELNHWKNHCNAREIIHEYRDTIDTRDPYYDYLDSIYKFCCKRIHSKTYDKFDFEYVKSILYEFEGDYRKINAKHRKRLLRDFGYNYYYY